MKVKNLFIKLELEGNGIVNFDSDDQKFIFNDQPNHHLKYFKNNCKFAKKNLYKNDDGSLDYKIKISSDCLKYNMFNEDKIAESPKIASYDAVLYSFIASPLGIVKGFMFPVENCKRSGAIGIYDAEQTNNAMSFLELHTKSGEKVSYDIAIDKKDTSMFYEENLGKITYSGGGNIDIMKLQFMSNDQIFDRHAFTPDKFDIFKAFLQLRLKNFNSELGYHKLKNSSIDLDEYGFMFSSENVLDLVKYILKCVLSIDIRRGGSYAKISALKIKLVYNPLKDLLEKDDNWIDIKSDTDIDNLSFEMNDFYELVDHAEALKKREALESAFKAKQALQKQATKAKLATKKDKNKSSEDTDE